MYHEVIDQGGEPIHTNEYFHLGKVTEFKACGWVACVQNGDFNCLNNFGQVILIVNCFQRCLYALQAFGGCNCNCVFFALIA